MKRLFVNLLSLISYRSMNVNVSLSLFRLSSNPACAAPLVNNTSPTVTNPQYHHRYNPRLRLDWFHQTAHPLKTSQLLQSSAGRKATLQESVFRTPLQVMLDTSTAVFVLGARYVQEVDI